MTTNINPKRGEPNWSSATNDVLNTFPHRWTRGLLYFLILFITIVLPWSFLAKVDQTGTAKGRLEPIGDTVKLDSVVTGTVEKILVKEGDTVKKGQPLLIVESQLVQAELQQATDKLKGQQDRLNEFDLLQKQLMISLTTQQQQNQAQELEKQSLVQQAKENLLTLENSYSLQQTEKQAIVHQLKATLDKSKTQSPILQARWKTILKQVEQYQKAAKEGAIAQIQVSEKQNQAREIQLLYEQNKGEIKENQERLVEAQSIYQRTIQQAKSDIEKAKLQVQEQERSYQSLTHSNQLALLKIQEQLNNLKMDLTTLKTEITQIQNQIKALNFQLAQRTIKASADGTIFQLPIKKEGAVVQLGTRIAEISPQGSYLILRVEMPTDQSGSLKNDLPVKLKFDAYPFQDYGIITGKVIKTSPTSNLIDTPNGKTPAYYLDIKLDQMCLKKDNQCIPLHAGDTAQAEVIIGQRRVIDFVIDPFKKLSKDGLKL